MPEERINTRDEILINLNVLIDYYDQFKIDYNDISIQIDDDDLIIIENPELMDSQILEHGECWVVVKFIEIVNFKQVFLRVYENGYKVIDNNKSSELYEINEENVNKLLTGLKPE